MHADVLRPAHDRRRTASGRPGVASNPARERPMTICVMFSRWAKASTSAGRSCPMSRSVSPPRRSARRKSVLDALGLDRVALLAPGRLDGHRDPARIEAGGEAARRAHDLLGKRVGADAYEQPLRRLPRPLDRVLAQIVDHLVVDPRGGAPQGQLAQGGEIAEREEILLRAGARSRACRPCPR